MIYSFFRGYIGNELCICCDKNSIDYGKIYFWDHENENPDETQEAWMNNVYLISNSFREFLDSLVVDNN